MQKDVSILTDEQLKLKLERCLEARTSLQETFNHKRNRTILKSDYLSNVENNIRKLESESERRATIRRLSGEALPRFTNDQEI